MIQIIQNIFTKLNNKKVNKQLNKKDSKQLNKKDNKLINKIQIYLPTEIVDIIISYNYNLLDLCKCSSELEYIKKYKYKLNQECWDELCKHQWAYEFIKDNFNIITNTRWETLCQTIKSIHNYKHFDIYTNFENHTLSSHIDYIILNNDKFYKDITYTQSMCYFKKLCNYKWALPVISVNINNITRGDNNKIIKSSGWSVLSKYEWAYDLLFQHYEEYGSYYDWRELCNHKWALPLIDKNANNLLQFSYNYIYIYNDKYGHVQKHNILINDNAQDAWSQLCKYEWAVPILIKYRELYYNYYDWRELSTHKWALPLLSFKYDLHTLCNYEWALDIIYKNIHNLKITDWYKLCNNEWAFNIINKYQHKLNMICLYELCKYKWALPIIRNNISKLDKTCKHILRNNDWYSINILSDNSWYAEVIKN